MSIIPGIENLAPERTLTSSGLAGSPKPLPVRRSTSLDRLEDVVPQAVGELLAVGEVVVAGLGRDREAGRGRQAGVGHLGEAGALAAEEVAHPGVALGRAVAPGVDVALGGLVRTVGAGVAVVAIGRAPPGGSGRPAARAVGDWVALSDSRPGCTRADGPPTSDAAGCRHRVLCRRAAGDRAPGPRYHAAA